MIFENKAPFDSLFTDRLAKNGIQCLRGATVLSFPRFQPVYFCTMHRDFPFLKWGKIPSSWMGYFGYCVSNRLNKNNIWT